MDIIEARKFYRSMTTQLSDQIDRFEVTRNELQEISDSMRAARESRSGELHDGQVGYGETISKMSADRLEAFEEHLEKVIISADAYIEAAEAHIREIHFYEENNMKMKWRRRRRISKVVADFDDNIKRQVDWKEYYASFRD